MNTQIDFIKVKDFLQQEITLQKGDYLYENDKSSYPVKEDFDFAKLLLYNCN